MVHWRLDIYGDVHRFERDNDADTVKDWAYTVDKGNLFLGDY